MRENINAFGRQSNDFTSDMDKTGEHKHSLVWEPNGHAN